MINLIEAKGKKLDIKYLGKGINGSLSFRIEILDMGMPYFSANFTFMGLSNMYLLLIIAKALLRYEEINSTFLNLNMYYPLQFENKPDALLVLMKHQLNDICSDSPTILLFATKEKVISSIPINEDDILNITALIENVLLSNKCYDEAYALSDVFNCNILEGDISVASVSGIDYDLANIMYTVVEEEYGLWK